MKKENSKNKDNLTKNIGGLDKDRIDNIIISTISQRDDIDESELRDLIKKGKSWDEILSMLDKRFIENLFKEVHELLKDKISFEDFKGFVEENRDLFTSLNYLTKIFSLKEHLTEKGKTSLANDFIVNSIFRFIEELMTSCETHYIDYFRWLFSNKKTLISEDIKKQREEIFNKYVKDKSIKINNFKDFQNSFKELFEDEIFKLYTLEYGSVKKIRRFMNHYLSEETKKRLIHTIGKEEIIDGISMPMYPSLCFNKTCREELECNKCPDNKICVTQIKCCEKNKKCKLKEEDYFNTIFNKVVTFLYEKYRTAHSLTVPPVIGKNVGRVILHKNKRYEIKGLDINSFIEILKEGLVNHIKESMKE